jgi:hypothetical protein
MKVQPGLGALGAAIVALLAAATPAAAQTIDEREAEAKVACLAGKADRGIEILAKLYAETNEPNYLFNQARCFQQNNRPDEALSRFREYLRKARDLSPQDREEVDRFIKECEAQKAESARLAAPAPTSPEAALQADQPARVASAKRMRTIGYVAAGVGVAALAFGATMSWQVKAKQDAFEKDHRLSFSQTEYNSGQRVEVLQWVGYAVGAVALGTGGIFYYLGSQGHEARSMAFVPVVTGTSAGALVRLPL